jgi:hypothetical protein
MTFLTEYDERFKRLYGYSRRMIQELVEMPPDYGKPKFL